MSDTKENKNINILGGKKIQCAIVLFLLEITFDSTKNKYFTEAKPHRFG